MNLAIQIASLIALIAIIVMVIYVIIILADVRVIVRNWKKVADVADLVMSPLTAVGSAILKFFGKLTKMNKEAQKEGETSEKK